VDKIKNKEERKMSYWILQCNINHFRWLDSIKEHQNDPITWSIRWYINEVELGDTVFIWLSKHKGKETRGIYAMAEITGLPDKEREPFLWEDQYWINQEARERLSGVNLELRYTKSIIDKPILKDELEAAGLGNLLILRMPQGGIYKLTEEEGEKIKRMLELR
jgi:predicted RNA-binding protein with PUA-like domain